MNILFCAQDPGGANALVPVIKKLTPRARICVLGVKSAAAVFKSRGIRCIDCINMTDIALENRINTFSPQVVVMGTSAGPSLEKRVALIARRKNIKTISVIDYWMNYALRYSDNASRNLKYLTDIVCVIDSDMKQGCVKDGIPAERIEITGNPHLSECVKNIKLNMLVKDQLLFISQALVVDPLSSFDEFSVLKDMLTYRGLEKFGKIIIKLHPKEAIDKYTDFIRKISVNTIVECVHGGNIYDLINESKIIFGMNSIVLLEASLAGKAVISYQPGLDKKEDTSISNKLGISDAFYTKKDLYKYFDDYGVKKSPRKKTAAINRLRKKYTSDDAVNNIIKLIYH